MITQQRQLNGLHDLFLYLALTVCYLAIITGQSTPWWLSIGFPLGMGAAHIFYKKGKAKPSQNKWWNTLILLVGAGLLVEYLVNPLIDVMIFGIQFVLTLIIIKLFSRQGPRDELQIYALSFLVMAAASTLNEEFFFGLLFASYVLTGTFALALFHLKTESTRQSVAQAPRSSPFDRTYMVVLAAISLLIFASSLLIFFAFPRVGLGLFADPSRNSISVTGFSDQVQMGDHGTLRDNPEVVMRAEFEDGKPANYTSFRWRAMTFDTYENNRWSRSLGDRSPSRQVSPSRNFSLGSIYTAPMQEIFDDDEALAVQIFLEPLGVPILPTLWPTSNLQMGSGDTPAILRSSMPNLLRDSYGDLRHDASDGVAINYGITVQPRPSTEELRRQSGRTLSETDTERYLQLPAIDPRLEELARELTADAPSNYEKAEAISSYFFTDFRYTVDLPVIDGDDPVAEFIFEHQAGHCEYFATSAVLMLRSIGVPARLVNGFLGGTWNDVGDYLTVRHGDAHAWVEIFVPELGWVPVDPTPPIESTFLERSGITRLVSDAVDAMRHNWVVWFLDYDMQSQLALLRDIGDALSADGGGSGERVDRSDDDQPQRRSPLPFRAIFLWGGWLSLLGFTFLRGVTHPRVDHWRYTAGVGLLMVSATLWVGWFQSWHLAWTTAAVVSVALAGVVPAMRRYQKTPSDLRLVTRLFGEIETAGARAHLARRPDEGPGGYLRRLAEELPEATPDLETFRGIYLATRFGGSRLDDQKRELIEQATRRIRKTLRRNK